MSTSCDLDWSGAQEGTATAFLPVNTLLTGRLQRDTAPDSTLWRWRRGVWRGSECVSGRGKVVTNK